MKLMFLGLFFLIVQQPYASFVSAVPGEVTEFRMVQDYGNIGILAHNYEAGQYFDRLAVGDSIHIYNDEAHQRYEVDEISRYIATDPYSPYSYFINANGQATSAADLFSQVYAAGDGRLILQTCYDGVNGRLFIMANPFVDDKIGVIRE